MAGASTAKECVLSITTATLNMETRRSRSVQPLDLGLASVLKNRARVQIIRLVYANVITMVPGRRIREKN